MAIFGTIVPDNTINFRNRIINGDMRIDQRNAGASVTVDSSNPIPFTLDRWNARQELSSGAFTVQRSTTAPTGFTNSLLATVTTADASITSSEGYSVYQGIEGFNTADLMWGTANAKTITLSFWVRSSITGSFSLILLNSGVTRSYGVLYTINSADTWEYKTVVIPGDTSGTWLTDNNLGIRVGFGLGAGSDRTVAVGWNAASPSITKAKVTGGVDWIATSGATFYITGVQLEVGSVATPFERRPYGTELALCQRYLPAMAYAGGTNPYLGAGMAYSTTAAFYTVSFPVTPRVPPTGLTVSAASHFAGFLVTTGTSNATAVVFSGANSHSAFVQLTGMTGLSGGNASLIYMSNSSALMLFTGCEL